MGELKTIGLQKSQKRIDEERRKREQEIRRRDIRRREAIKKRKKKLIKIYTVMAVLTVVLLVLAVQLLMNLFSDKKDKKVEVKADSQRQENESVLDSVYDNVGKKEFLETDYPYTEDMFQYTHEDELIEKLKEINVSDEEIEKKIKFLIRNAQAYPDNVLKLVIRNPIAIDFALAYPFKKETVYENEPDVKKEYKKGEIPMFLQWDERWGYAPYGDGIIGLDGCGPTCMSMVVIGLTGNTEYTPKYVADYAQNNGYYLMGSGTTWEFMLSGCNYFGVSARELSLNEDLMMNAVLRDKPIIASMSPGDFTEGGHFIVITDYEDGMFTVNDPNSIKNSERGWTYRELSKQIKNMWVYEKKSKINEIE